MLLQDTGAMQHTLHTPPARPPACCLLACLQLNRFGRGCSAVARFGDVFEVQSYEPHASKQYRVSRLDHAGPPIMPVPDRAVAPRTGCVSMRAWLPCGPSIHSVEEPPPPRRRRRRAHLPPPTPASRLPPRACFMHSEQSRAVRCAAVRLAAP